MSETEEQHGLPWLVRGLAERTGLDFDGCHRDRMIDTVERMRRVSGCRTHDAYAELLEHDRLARGSLIDGLTVGETYFFREPAHFDLLRQTIAPARRERDSDGTLRVWSAGCASGEEPYSVAITLAEMGVLDRSSIVGTDVSERALDRARAAVYTQWSLRRCDEDQRRTWFHPEGRRFRLEDPYRGSVQWQARGLLEGPPAGAFDVVLCRNVLIYLAPEAVAAAAESLHAALAPDGWLLLGASDPVLEHPGLRRVFGSHGVAYRRAERRPRPARAERTVPSATTSAPRPPRPVRPPTGYPSTRLTTVRRPSPDDPSPPAARPDVVGADDIRVLGSTGEAGAAGRAVDAAISDDPDNAELRCLAATIQLDAGRPADAARAAAAAAYLDPELAVAHLLLARAEHTIGHSRRAQRSYRNALQLLRAMPPDVHVPLTDGERAGDLATVAAAALAEAQGPLRR